MVDREREARVVALLENCVRMELQVTNGGFGLGLSDEAIEQLMGGVTAGVLYAFSLDWSPDWVHEGEVHAREEGGAWFARCWTCLLDSPAAISRDAAATWAHEHEASH